MLEPIEKITVKAPVELVGDVTKVIAQKRGKILAIEQKEYLTFVVGELPAAETFDLSEAMRGATGGRAFWGLEFASWSPVPASMQLQVIQEVRKRKGLTPEPPKAQDFMER